MNNTLIGGFSPFNSPNAKGRLTALHSNLYHKKHEESEYLAKQISTQNDIKTVTEYLAFDPITGNATQVRTTDPSTGSVTEKIIEYAYTDPAYVAMGPKSVDATYSNQLGLVSLEKTLRDNVLIGGTRTTFDKNLLTRKFNTGTLAYESVSTARDWKPKKTFVFNGNVTPTSWKEVNEFTLFSPRGAVLEQKTPATSTSAGTVARYSAMKLGYDDRFATTEVSDSKYTESTFSGAEDYNSTTGYFGGEVKLGTNATVNTSAPYIHTGTKSLKISPNGNGFVYKIAATELNLARTYVARVWVYNNGNSSAGLKYQFLNSSNAVIKEDVVNLNSSTAFSANQNGYTYAKKDGWVLLTLQVTLPASLTGLNFVLSCVNTSTTTDAYFDDLRLHPINSSMKNYIYDVQSERITQVLDENGFYQTIEYNEIGKIKKIWQETLDGVKLVTETNLNYYRISAPTVQY